MPRRYHGYKVRHASRQVGFFVRLMVSASHLGEWKLSSVCVHAPRPAPTLRNRAIFAIRRVRWQELAFFGSKCARPNELEMLSRQRPKTPYPTSSDHRVEEDGSSVLTTGRPGVFIRPRDPERAWRDATWQERSHPLAFELHADETSALCHRSARQTVLFGHSHRRTPFNFESQPVGGLRHFWVTRWKIKHAAPHMRNFSGCDTFVLGGSRH